MSPLKRNPSSLVTRRNLLQCFGTTGVAGLAGCLGRDPEADDPPTPAPGVGGETPVQSEGPDQPQMGGELRVGLSANIGNWDPTTITDSTSAMTVRTLIYEGLVATSHDGEITPFLATGWDQIDDVTVRFELRENVTFHNGEAFHAEQVKRSFERYEGTIRGPDVFEWYVASEILDDHTIEIEIQQPDAVFLRSVGVGILPDALLDASDEGANLDDVEEHPPIGTGPYRFREFRDDELYRVTSYPDHWFEGNDIVPSEPPIEDVTFRIIREDGARVSALRSGDIDLSYGLPSTTYSDFDTDDGFIVDSSLSTGYDMVLYPVHFSPWANVNVRRGVNHLIPRDIITDEIYNGWRTPAYTVVSPVNDAFEDEAFEARMREEYGAFDVERATELIEHGFVEEGVDAPLSSRIITTSDSADWVRWTELVKESLENTGLFEMEMDTMEWTSFASRITTDGSHENNELVVVGLSTGFDPDGYFRSVLHPDRFTPGCCNIHHYEDTLLTQMIDNGRFDPDIAFDTDRRINHYFALQEETLKRSPLSFVSFSQGVDVMVSDRVKNWRTYPINNGKIIGGLYYPPSNQVSWIAGEPFSS